MKPQPLLSQETLNTLLFAGLIQTAPVWPMPGHHTLRELADRRCRVRNQDPLAGVTTS